MGVPTDDSSTSPGSARETLADLAADVEAAIWQRHARKEGAEVRFLCPSHDDTHPSARWNPRKQVWTCDACGAGGGTKHLAEQLGIPVATRRHQPSPERRRIVATYDYRDEQSKLLFQAVRYQPKGFAQRQPDGAGGWLWDLKGVRRVLYRLPELLAADPAAMVHVVEGEKDADRLASLGLVATTNPQGAGKWRDEYATCLHSRHVVVLPDNDDAGRRHAEKVARSLQRLAAGVKVVELPDLPPKGDVSDWLDAGGTVDGLTQLVAVATRPASEPPAAPAAAGGFHLTDLGNAERLAALHGQNLRYCRLWGDWLLWDGRRWRRDDTGAVYRLAKKTLASIYAEAAAAGSSEERRRIGEWALTSEGRQRLEAMVALAEKTEEAIPVTPADLDADPWLLTCSNGTVDLRTGLLSPHRREHLLTKLCPAEYDPGARLDLWDRFLDEATGGDRELQAFLQRAVGYSLTGDTSEEKLFFVHGPAASGKSTFLEAVKGTLGEHAATADFEAFLARRDVGGPRNDIARLAGARVVVSVEVDEGKKLAEGLVKAIAGGDTVTARFLYREPFEFFPTFKLWLAANHAPEVKDDDDAMWRRILRIPFEHVVPKAKRDPHVKATLRNPKAGGPAILAWAVRGCLAWQREGLGVPPVVEAATEAYRQDMDPLRLFLAEFCELKAGATVQASSLRRAYEAWAKESGERHVLAGRAWGEKLRRHGCEPGRQDVGGRRVRVWRGIRLLDEPEPEALQLDGPEALAESRTDPQPRTHPDAKSDNLGALPPHEGVYRNARPDASGRQNPSGAARIGESVRAADSRWLAWGGWLGYIGVRVEGVEVAGGREGWARAERELDEAQRRTVLEALTHGLDADLDGGPPAEGEMGAGGLSPV